MSRSTKNRGHTITKMGTFWLIIQFFESLRKADRTSPSLVRSCIYIIVRVCFSNVFTPVNFAFCNAVYLFFFIVKSLMKVNTMKTVAITATIPNSNHVSSDLYGLSALFQ